MMSYDNEQTGMRDENAWVILALSLLLLLAAAVSSFAQAPAATPGAAATGVTPPSDYVIGADDVLRVVFWRDEAMSGDVSVRPDGKITLPLLNDVMAAGLTPEQLRVAVTERAAKLVEEPSVTVIVKEIRSRKVFILGQVTKPGPYPLGGSATVLQIIATAGGVLEFANSKNIIITRTEQGKARTFKFNYEDVSKGKNLAQNIELKPGDTIIVP